jgi:CYTH domain-containing protein
LAQLHEAIDTIAHELERHGARDVEIERKYLLSALPPDMPPGDLVTMEQGYLPGQRLIERLRREVSGDGERLTRTVKTGSGIARTELEEGTTPDVFDAMWPLTSGRRVGKRRHRVSDGSLIWEIDEFTDRALVLAEVELGDTSLHPEIPAWLQPVVVREVTGEAEYLNANLAR